MNPVRRYATALALASGLSSGCAPIVVTAKVDELGCAPVPVSGVVTQKNKFTLAKVLIGGKALEGINIENTPELHMWMSEAARDLATIQYLRCVAVKSGEAGAEDAELQNCIENKRLFFALKPKPHEFAQYVRDNPCGSSRVSNENALRIADQLSAEFYRAIKVHTRPLTEDDFRRVTELMSHLSLLRPRNGHVFYFAGEMKRRLGRKDEARQEFYLYIENEPKQQAGAIEGDVAIKVCSQTSTGYCRQRSGWVRHVIANDFYEKGINETDPENARHYLATALKFAQRSLDFFPDGFSQLVPTIVVERSTRQRISVLDAALK